MQLELDAVENGGSAGWVCIRDALEADRRVTHGRQSHPRSLVIQDCRLLRELEHALGNREPVRARVVLGSEVTKWQVELRREDENGQSRLEPDAAVCQSHPHGHRHECDAKRRSHLEHGAREEGDPERFHRRAAIALARLGDQAGLRASTVERAERRQSADDVEEVCREEDERAPLSPCLPFRVPADQDHEHRNEWKRQQHEQRRNEIDRRDPCDHRERNEQGEHELRDEPREVGVECVDSLNRHRCDLRARGIIERGRLVVEPPLDQLEPELREDARGRDAAHKLEAPGEDTAAREHHSEEHQVAGHVVERRAVEGAGDDTCEQRCLEKDEQCGREAECDVRCEECSRRPGTAQEARIERAHRTRLPRPVLHPPLPTTARDRR